MIISPCKIQPPLNTDGQSADGPSVNETVMSASNTPESGDTSVIPCVGYAVVLPHVAKNLEEEPLSISTVTLASVIVSSPAADTL
mgnify:CR=1 FL=1